MDATYPTARSVRHAFTVLGRLPAEALINLAERLIDCLDLTEPDCDLEPEEDACNAGECGGLVMRGDSHPGDADDAEPEEDDDDDAEAEPLASGTLRPERDGFVRVWRKRPGRIALMPGCRRSWHDRVVSLLTDLDLPSVIRIGAASHRIRFLGGPMRKEKADSIGAADGRPAARAGTDYRWKSGPSIPARTPAHVRGRK